MTDTQRTYYVYTARQRIASLANHRPAFCQSIADAARIPDDAETVYSVSGDVFQVEAEALVIDHLAGRYTHGATVEQIRPAPRTADEKLDAARNVLRADYWQDVANVISDLRDEIAAGNITDTDGATRHIDETVDGHHRVIYTGQAIECLLFSRNEDAYQDEMGETPDFASGAQWWSQLAYFAFRADIMGEIGDLDDFIAANKPRPYAECDDCDGEIETEADAHVYADEDVTVCADCATARDDEKKTANPDA